MLNNIFYGNGDGIGKTENKRKSLMEYLNIRTKQFFLCLLTDSEISSMLSGQK